MIGFIALPKPSASYWLTGYFIRPGRTGSVHSLVNQSLLAVLARVYGTVGPALGVWLPIALGVAAAGLVGGAMLSRAGRPVQGWTLVGITSVLVSPISWDHHWVWIVPVLALLAGLAMTARPLARAGYLVAVVLIAGVMGSWPWRWSGYRAYVPRRGLLGWFVKPPEVTQLTVLHGWKLLTWNLWVAVGSVIYLALLAAAVVAWRKRPRRAVTAKDKAEAKAKAKDKVKPPAAPSPIDALLARADAILSASHPLNGAASGPAKADQTAHADGDLDPGEHPNDTDDSGRPADACGEAEPTASRPAAALPRPTR